MKPTSFGEDQLVTPRISVVVPLFNKRLFVSQALSSALLQEDPPFEVVVVDDGSTDGSAELLTEIAERHALQIVSQARSGPGGARNTGIRRTSGTHIAFLDADDRWLPGHLSVIRSLVKRYPRAGAFATSYYEEDSKGVLSGPSTRVAGVDDRDGIVDFFRVVASRPLPFYTSSLCVRRDVFAEVGLFKEMVFAAEDLEMWCRIALVYPIAFDHRRTVVYRRDVAGRPWSGPSPSDTTALYTTLTDLIKVSVESRRRHIESYLGRLRTQEAASYLAAGKCRAARSALRTVRPRKGRVKWFACYVLSTLGPQLSRTSFSAMRTWRTLVRRISRLRRLGRGRSIIDSADSS